MKKVEIVKMTLNNFKGIRHMEVPFGSDTGILGANGTGKSTIVDAYTWCLFGTDANGRTDSGRGGFSVKTLGTDGKPIHHLDHWVEVQLSVNGVVSVLRRELKEDWVTKRGETEPRLAGNTTRYEWNGNTIKAGEYIKRISELITDFDKMHILSTPGAFCAMDWREQLEILHGVIGSVSHKDIAMAGDKSWQEVGEMIGMGGAEELRKTLAAEIRKCNEDMAELTHRKNETAEYIEANSDPTMDIAECKAALKDMESELDETMSLIGNESGAESARKEEISRLRNDILHIKNSDLKSKNSIYEEVAKNVAEKNARRNELAAEIRKVEREYESERYLYSTSAASAGRRIAREKDVINSIEGDLKKLREQWMNVDAEEYSGDEGELICPITNEACDGTSTKMQVHNCRVKAREEWNERKAKRLAAIESDAKMITDDKAKHQATISALEKELEGLEHAHKLKAESIQAKAESLKAEYDSTEEYKEDPDKAWAESPEHKNAEADIKAAEDKIAELMAPTASDAQSELNERKEDLKKRIAELRGKIMMEEDVIAQSRKRLGELDEKIAERAQEKADCERKQDILKLINQARIKEMERRISARFEITTFRFFEEQLNGGYTDTCQAMVDGVPYSDLNTAKKINCGIDIINALTYLYGVSVPVFIDNAESVTKIDSTNGQIVRLLVRDHENLKVLCLDK